MGNLDKKRGKDSEVSATSPEAVDNRVMQLLEELRLGLRRMRVASAAESNGSDGLTESLTDEELAVLVREFRKKLARKSSGCESLTA